MNDIIFDGPSAQRVRIDPDILPSALETAWGRVATVNTFNEFIKGKRFKNPDTGKQVLFKSLPEDEQSKIRNQWEGKNKKESHSPINIVESIVRPKGWRSSGDEPSLTKTNRKAWETEHTAKTPGGSVVLGTIHMDDEDTSTGAMRHSDPIAQASFKEHVIGTATKAVKEALRAGKKIVVLSEGMPYDEDALGDSNDWNEQHAVAKAVHKISKGKAVQDTWDDGPVSLSNLNSDVWKRMSTAAGGDIVKAKGALAVFMQGQGQSWDSMIEEGWVDDSVADIVKKATGVDPRKQLSKRNQQKFYDMAFPGDAGKPHTEVSAIGEIYNAARQENLLRKISEIESNGGVVIAAPGASHAYNLKGVLGGVDKNASNQDLETAWGWNARTAAMVNEILANLNPNVVSGAKSISPTVQRDGDGVRVYTVPGSNGGGYTVTVDSTSPDNVRVACSCPFFRYQGPEHWATVGGYLYGEPVGDASPPTRKDPDGKNRVCKHIAAVLKQPTYKMAATTPVPAQFDVNEPGILTRDEYLSAINRSDKHHSDDSYDFSLSSINRPPASLIGRLYPVYDRNVEVLRLWESTSGQYITLDTSGSTADPIAVLHNGTLYHTALGAKIPNEYVDAYGGPPARGGLEYKPLGIQKRVLVKYIDEYMALVNDVAKHNLAKYPIVLQRTLQNGEMLTLRAARQPEKNKGVELAVLDSQSKVLGFASDEWGATLITVGKEARARGVGRWLAKVWHEWNPKYDSGGMTYRGNALMSAHWADRVREFLDRGWYSQMVRDGRITPERVKLITKDLPQRSTSAPSKFELSLAPPAPAIQPMVRSDGQSYILVYDRAILTGNTTVDNIDENLIYGYAFIRDTSQGMYLYSIEYERKFEGFTLRAILQLARDNGYRLYVGDRVVHDLIVADAESIPGVKRDGDYIEITKDVFPLQDAASLERVMRRRVDKFGELGDRLIEMAESKW